MTNYASGGQNWHCRGFHMFFFVEVLHPVNFVNVTHVFIISMKLLIYQNSWLNFERSYAFLYLYKQSFLGEQPKAQEHSCYQMAPFKDRLGHFTLCDLEQDTLIIVLVQPRKTHPDITEKLLTWT